MFTWRSDPARCSAGRLSENPRIPGKDVGKPASNTGYTMNLRLLHLPVVAAATLVLVSGCSPARDSGPVNQKSRTSPAYTVTVLDSLASGAPHPTCINDNGEVVGSISIADEESYPVLWIGHSLTKLPCPIGRPWGEAASINTTGDIIGYAYSDWGKTHLGGDYRAVLWHDGQVSELPMPRNYRLSRGIAINDRGDVLCSLGEIPTPFHSCLRSKGHEWTLEGAAFGLSQDGAVVGFANDAYGRAHACVWTDGRPEAQDPLPGCRTSSADSINATGDIAGECNSGQAFIRTSSGAAFITTADTPWAIAEGMNDKREIVGLGRHKQGSEVSYPFLWRDGKILDLNQAIPADSGFVIGSALGINNRGQIIVTGTFRGTDAAAVLTPS